MRIKRRSGFGHMVFLVWLRAIKLPNTKPCTAIIKDLASFSYLPCSRWSLVLHFSLKQKKKTYSKYLICNSLRTLLSQKKIENQLRYSSSNLKFYEKLEKCCQNQLRNENKEAEWIWTYGLFSLGKRYNSQIPNLAQK